MISQQENDPFFENDEAAEYIRQKPSTLPSWRSRGQGPPFVKIGRKILYRRSALDAFIARCEVDPAKRGAA